MTGQAPPPVRWFGEAESRTLWDRLNGDRFAVTGQGISTSWMVFKDGVWSEDADLDFAMSVEELIRVLRAAKLPEDDDGSSAKARGAEIKRLQRDSAVRSMSMGLRDRHTIRVSAEQLDIRDDVVCTADGLALDLRTGTVRAAEPFDMLSLRLGAPWRPEATYAGWETFLERVIPDAELRNYLQRMVGRTLLSGHGRRGTVWLEGPSGTGKSTVLYVLEKVFGQHAASASPALLNGNDREQNLSMHALRGVRLATLSETGREALNVVAIKRMTGGDTVATRTHHAEYVTWQPRFTVWTASNEPPAGNADADEAFWRRVIIVPMRERGDPAAILGNVGAQIVREESAGVLQWALRGAAMWREDDSEPAAVAEIREAMRGDSDPLLRWVSREVEAGRLGLRASARVRVDDLLAEYVRVTSPAVPPGTTQVYRTVLDVLGLPESAAVRGRWDGEANVWRIDGVEMLTRRSPHGVEM